jgi:hypothetical protein
MKKSRWLIVALPVLLVLLVLVIYQYGYLRVKEEINLIKEEQAVKGKTLQKYLAVLAEKPALEKELAALREQRKADGSKMMEGDSPTLASASLQEMVKGIITSRGGVISSERVGKVEDVIPLSSGQSEEEAKTAKTRKTPGEKKGKPEEKSQFKIITVSVDFVVPETGALRDILYFIETRTPSLIIKELDPRVRNFKEPRELMVKMDVSALFGGK